ncbi:MAG TPA: phosphoglucosamine mutase [Vicinamibacterales bacterium]|nr:phosphoglucosamine mutase [Vicinamibacterales bacterium]
MSRLFGTDGVRGIAGQTPLDERTIERLGAALVRALPHPGRPLRLVAGRDTRESGPWIERALARGVHSQGATLTSAGVIPTPAVAYISRALGFDAGLVISASHNPFQDNGIKVFSGRGEKFSEKLEREIEAIVDEDSWQVDPGTEPEIEPCDFTDRYIAHAREALPDAAPLGKVRIALDLANGATTSVAPKVFRGYGFDVTITGDRADGRNINLECGSTHPDRLRRIVRDGGHRLGVAFDGDGDRAIFVDADGRIVDGDAVLLMCASQMQTSGALPGNAIVATVMSNIGLELALKQRGIGMVRCAVGDKYVMEEMLQRGIGLGGEQSGHIIFLDHLFTGDGIVTALRVLRVMAETGRELADLASDLKTFPQVLVNVRVREKRELGELPPVAGAVRQVERSLEGQGRLLVRYSGTEPLLRIMIEGRDQHEIQAWAQQIADAVRREIGA